RVEEQGIARGRELDAARRAMQQLHAELVLELRDAPARGRERDVARRGGLRDAARLRDADEERERGEVGAHQERKRRGEIAPAWSRAIGSGSSSTALASVSAAIGPHSRPREPSPVSTWMPSTAVAPP